MSGTLGKDFRQRKGAKPELRNSGDAAAGLRASPHTCVPRLLTVPGKGHLKELKSL